MGNVPLSFHFSGAPIFILPLKIYYGQTIKNSLAIRLRNLDCKSLPELNRQHGRERVKGSRAYIKPDENSKVNFTLKGYALARVLTSPRGSRLHGKSIHNCSFQSCSTIFFLSFSFLHFDGIKNSSQWENFEKHDKVFSNWKKIELSNFPAARPQL